MRITHQHYLLTFYFTAFQGIEVIVMTCAFDDAMLCHATCNMDLVVAFDGTCCMFSFLGIHDSAFMMY